MTESITESLRQWLHQRGLPAEGLQPGGSCAVVFDRVRVRMQPRSDGLLLETRLATLPAAAAARDAILERALRSSAARVRSTVACVSVDDAAGALWLQQLIPSSVSPDALDEVVGALVNETEHWRSAL